MFQPMLWSTHMGSIRKPSTIWSTIKALPCIPLSRSVLYCGVPPMTSFVSLNSKAESIQRQKHPGLHTPTTSFTLLTVINAFASICRTWLISWAYALLSRIVTSSSFFLSCQKEACNKADCIQHKCHNGYGNRNIMHKNHGKTGDTSPDNISRYQKKQMAGQSPESPAWCLCILSVCSFSWIQSPVNSLWTNAAKNGFLWWIYYHRKSFK